MGGFVASINPEFTRWYSKPTIQEKREELVNGLTASMESALLAYKSFNSYLPERIILYRDGVGNGQLQFVENYELPQFKAAFERVAPSYNPGLTFIVVQKRINTKFFMQTSKPGQDSLMNPPPEFFIVSQDIRHGTTTPSRFAVLSNENHFDVGTMYERSHHRTFDRTEPRGSPRIFPPVINLS